MNIKKTMPVDGEIIVELEGSLSGDDSVRELEQLFGEIERSPQRIITFNLQKVPAINSSNLGKIFMFFNRLRAEGRTLRIKGCSDTLYRTFQLIEMENHIPYEREAT
jgi:anti-anti-sigma regulatory factor